MNQSPSTSQRDQSNDRKIAWGMLASLTGRIVAALGGLVLVPCLYRYFTAEEVGIWFLIAQPAVLLSLLDFGLTPTITRKIALLSANSSPESDSSGQSSARLASVVAMAKRLFTINSIIVFIICLGFGQWIANHVQYDDAYRPLLRNVFLLAALSYALQAYSSRFMAQLAGRGHVGPAAGVAAGVRLLGIIAKLVAVVLGGRLLSIAIIDVLVSGLTIFVAKLAIRRLEPSAHGILDGVWCRATAGELRPLAIRSWLTGLGAFLILKTDQYFIVFGLGTASLPDYQSTLFVFEQLHQVAMIATVASGVFISQLWALGDFAGMHRLIRRNMDIAMTIMIGGAAFLLLCGETLFAVWLGENHHVGLAIMSVFTTMLVLETHHVVFAKATTASGDEGFAASAILAGGLNLVLTSILIRTHGLLGVAAATMIAQMLTNNWYVIYRAHRRLRMSFWVHVKECVIPYLAIALCTAGPSLALRWKFPTMSDWLQVAIVTTWIGIICLAFIWKRHFAFPLRKSTSVIDSLAQANLAEESDLAA